MMKLGMREEMVTCDFRWMDGGGDLRSMWWGYERWRVAMRFGRLGKVVG